MTDLNDLRRATVKRTMTAYHHDVDPWTPSDWAMATTGELGELCNLLKKVRRGEQVSFSEIADEFADTLIYLDLFAWSVGISLAEAVVAKFNRKSQEIGCDIFLGKSEENARS